MAERKNDLKISVANKEYLLEDLLKIVMNIPSEAANNLFNELNITFGRELRISVLKKVFKNAVALTRSERNTLADEMNYRLSWFNKYTETQLINLFNFYKDAELETLYIRKLWEAMLEDLGSNKISRENFERLLALQEKKYQKEDIIVYNNNFNDVFFDEAGKLDGLTPEEIRPVLYKSSTIVEIRQIGKKYGVNVPSRLRKAELLEIIINELKDTDKYSEELEENLNKLSILLLQRFAKDNNIKASTELKKEEVIEYVLANAKQTKEAYYIPKDTDYHLEASDLGEPVEEIIEEPVAEEIVEEPVAEEIVEEPVVEEIIEEPVAEEIIEEPVVEEIVEESVVEEIVEEPVVEAVEYTPPQTRLVEEENKFDPSTVKGQVLNTVTFGEIKPKQFVEIAALEKVFNETEPSVSKRDKHQTQTLELVIPKKKKSVFGIIMKVLLIVIIVIINLLIILSLYALFTPNGVPQLKSVEEFITKYIFHFDFFEKIRAFVQGLMN